MAAGGAHVLHVMPAPCLGHALLGAVHLGHYGRYQRPIHGLREEADRRGRGRIHSVDDRRLIDHVRESVVVHGQRGVLRQLASAARAPQTA